jgi:hypothetical protein
MSLELDHVFVCTDVGAPQADALARFGLVEGKPNRHPGQGTANRRFFFENAFLELLWVDDPREAQGPDVARTGLWERWSRRTAGASPFGICFRPAAGTALDQPPFECWEYRPPYLPEPLAIHMSTDSADASGPLIFYLAFGRPARSADAAHRQPLDHPAGLREITAVTIAAPNFPDPAACQKLEELCSQVHFVSGAEQLLELEFHGAVSNRIADFRSALPLVFRW